MPETILKAPNYFDREIDLTQRTTPVGGVPATVVGAAEKGPAFIPVTVGSYQDFQDKFGDINPKFVGGYAAQKFLEGKGSELASVNYIRVLGCGANASSEDISDTETYGTVKNAGMQVVGDGVPVVSGALQGVVQMLVAKHAIATNEAFGFPVFNDNRSYPGDDGFGGGADTANLVRAVLFTTTDSRFIVASGSVGATFNPADLDAGTDNFEAAFVGTEGQLKDKFKLILSSSAGSSFASDDGFAGLRVFSASLDPSSDQYVGKILNTNPLDFADKKHLLYVHYPVDAELAAVSSSLASSNQPTVAVLSGSADANSLGIGFSTAFGMFNTRYRSPKTPFFISQPFGGVEFDLFRVEALDDGAYANDKFKISITDLQASTNPAVQYGSFTLQVRSFSDTDADPQVLEQFSNLSLDTESDNYVIKVIGDKKTTFNFDAIEVSDRGIVVSGKYGNRSRYIRVVPSSHLDSGEVPEKALPFGFRGHQMLLTNLALTDQTGSAPTIISGVSSSLHGGNGASLSGSIVPPVPFRFTITRNNLATSGAEGNPGTQTVLDGRLFWGVKFERVNGNVLNANSSDTPNAIIENFTKFTGIEQLEVLTTGSQSDDLNNNKFTLAKVALPVSASATSRRLSER